MVKLSKRMQQGLEVVDKEKEFSLEEAVGFVEKFPQVKFDETVELHFHLNINPKSADQIIRGTIILPNGTGKQVRLAVFCKGEQSQKAKEMGADFVGAQDLIEKVSKGFLDFDKVIATPDMMRDLSKLGKILGPRGLMPSPKAGTVSANVEKAIEDVKAGKVEFKSDKQAGIHLGIGKRSFSKEKLFENATTLLDALNHAKPAAVKGHLIKGAFLSTTMGPSVKVAV